MAQKKPVVLYGGKLEELRSGDNLNALASEVDVVTMTNSSGADIDGGMAAYVSGAGAIAKSNAAADATARFLGVVQATITNTSTGAVQTDGVIVQADWTAATGSATLTAGSDYYLSGTTAGQITATPPSASGSWVLPIGTALSGTELEISPQRAVKLA